MAGIDMTSGSIYRKLFKVSIPIIITNVIHMAYNLTDIFWLGKNSQDDVSAVGSMGLFLWAGMSIVALTKTGIEVRVSQSYGKKDNYGISKYASSGLFLTIIVAAMYSMLLFFFREEIIRIFNFESRELTRIANDYLSITVFSVFFLMLSYAYISVHNGKGNTKTVVYFLGASLAINMILDPIFILKFDFGAKGAAYATLIAAASGVAMFSIYSYFISGEYKKFWSNIDFSKMKDLLNLGFVPMVTQLSFCGVYMIMTVYIIRFGDEYIAVNTIGSQVESLTWIIGGAATTAVTVFTGQNIAVKKYQRIAKGFTFIMILMTGYSLVVTALFIFRGDILFTIFLPHEPETVKLGVEYLFINAFAQIFMMIEGVITGFFNGQSKTKIPAIANFIGNGIRIPLAVLLASYYGINGVWIAVCISASIKGIILLIAFFISVLKNNEFKVRYFILKKEAYYVKRS